MYKLGRNSWLRFLVGFSRAFSCITSSGLGDTWSRTCAHTHSRLEPWLYVMYTVSVCNVHSECMCVHVSWDVPYLELAFKTSQTSFRILSAQLLYTPAQVAGRDLSVPARHSLQDCIVDEDILLLYHSITHKSSRVDNNENVIPFNINREMERLCTYWALNHLHSLVAEVFNGACYINHFLFLNLFQYSVNGDQCPSSTHTSTAGEGVQHTYPQSVM